MRIVGRGFSFKRTWQRVRSVPGLGRYSAVLATLAAFGLVAFVVILSNQKYIPPWETRQVISADFTQAPAVNPDELPEVRIAGVRVGVVTGSEVTRKGHARLTMSIEPGNPIYSNAQIVLRAKNPLNVMYLEINPGGPPARPLPEGGVVPVYQTKRPTQLDEIFNHLDARSRAAVTALLSTSDSALANAPQNLPNGLNATGDTFVAFKPVLEKLSDRRQKIREVVTALSQISNAVGGNDERLTRLANSTQDTLRVLDNRGGDLQEALDALPGATDQLRTTMHGVQGLTGELNPTLGKLNEAAGPLTRTLPKVSGVMDQLRKVSRAANPVVKKAGPVVQDLRPIVDDVHKSLGDLEPITRQLKPITGTLVPYLPDLDAFVYNTSSVFSGNDANGGFVRGHLEVPLPDGGVLPGTHGGEAYPRDGGNR